MKKYLLIATILCVPIAAFGWGIGLIGGGSESAAVDGLSGDFFVCDWSGSTGWTTENVCSNNEEFGSVTGTTGLSSGAGTATAAHSGESYGVETWTNNSTTEFHAKFKFSIDALPDDDADRTDYLLVRGNDGAGQNENDMVTFGIEHTGGNPVLWAYIYDTTSYTGSTTIVASTDYWIVIDVVFDGATGSLKVYLSTDSTVTSGEIEINQTALQTSEYGRNYPDTIWVGPRYNITGGQVIQTFDDLEVDDDTSYLD